MLLRKKKPKQVNVYWKKKSQQSFVHLFKLPRISPPALFIEMNRPPAHQHNLFSWLIKTYFWGYGAQHVEFYNGHNIHEYSQNMQNHYYRNREILWKNCWRWWFLKFIRKGATEIIQIHFQFTRTKNNCECNECVLQVTGECCKSELFRLFINYTALRDESKSLSEFFLHTT